MPPLRPPLRPASACCVSSRSRRRSPSRLARSRRPVKTAHVEAELVAAKTALVPGEPITVALRLVLEKGWHTYWRNPGDSGLPTTLAWTLPAGIEAGPIEWPAPRDAAGRAARQLRLRRRGAAPRRDVAAAFSSCRRHARRSSRRARIGSCARKCASRKARTSRWRCRWRDSAAPDARWGAPARRRARRAAATARRLARQRGGPGHDDRGDVRAAAGCRRSRHDSLLPVRTGPDRSVGAAARRARRRRARADVAGRIHAFGSARQARRRRDRRRRIRRRTRRDDRRRGRPAASPRGREPRRRLPPCSISRRPAARTATRSPSRSPSCPRSSAASILNLMPCVFPVLTLKVLGFATHRDTRPTMRTRPSRSPRASC